MSEEQKPKKSPMGFFFSLGDRATGGDPVRKADFDYGMMWILFLAFMTICIRNWFYFFNTFDVSFLAWGLIGGAISYFQYFALTSFWQRRKSIKDLYKNKKPEKEESKDIEDDSIDEMMGEFEDE